MREFPRDSPKFEATGNILAIQSGKMGKEKMDLS